jgi:uncharacterized protein YutE (UPF0331/DUF86 family)
MQLEIYLQETRRLAEKNTALLDEVRQRLKNAEALSALEQAGVLHALQVLIENAIGKAKHTLKSINKTVPVSAYEVFETLAESGVVDIKDLDQWNAVIGLRNKIVHDYMNIDPAKISKIIENKAYELVTKFLLAPISQ